MRAILATALIGAVIFGAPHALNAAPKAKNPEPQQTGMGPAAPAVATQSCPGNDDALGVTRVVEIDTTGGPGFGFQHYKAYDFLNPKEVVLTFDDGPLPTHTRTILAALATECVKATFFTVGKLAAGYPEVLRQVVKGGHTVGMHTVTHPNLAKMPFEKAKAEIEKSVSIASRAAGAPVAPFFRFPYLKDSPELLKYLGSRNIAVFSTDLDSFDFKRRSPKRLIKNIMANLGRKDKGILLMHDIQPNTAKALPQLLKELKAKGYKIVHLTPKAPVVTLVEYDKLIEKDVKGLAAGNQRPLSSVVRTISGDQ
jgi:peptidoglycan/xylan/chitin deacetylase (PgdA/CDA1 family)